MKRGVRAIRVALIGVSGFGEVHYRDILEQIECGTMRLSAATVINQADESEKCSKLRSLGCEVFTDYREMLAQFGDRLDIVFVPTGIAQHAPMTIAALEAGSNVMVEKPAAATIQSIRAMQEAESRTGRFVAVGFQHIYAAETLTMKRAILDGRLGAVQSIKCRGLWPRLDNYYQRAAWAGRLRIGDEWILDSPFNNAMAHQLNMICFLAGAEIAQSARPISVEAELHRAHDIESPDTAALRVRTAEGIPLFFFATHCCEGYLNPEIIVRGESGRIFWTFGETRIEIDGRPTVVLPSESETGVRRSLMRQLGRRLSDPSAFVCHLGIAAGHTLIVNGAHESSPVHRIKPEFVRRYPSEDSVRTEIVGIDGVIERAFNQEKLFSELALPWAITGKRFDVGGYSIFPREVRA